MIEQATQILAQDNAELACAYIQKSAVEKAIPEIDKRLANVSCWVTDSVFCFCLCFCDICCDIHLFSDLTCLIKLVLMPYDAFAGV